MLMSIKRFVLLKVNLNVRSIYSLPKKSVIRSFINKKRTYISLSRYTKTYNSFGKHVINNTKSIEIQELH